MIVCSFCWIKRVTLKATALLCNPVITILLWQQLFDRHIVFEAIDSLDVVDELACQIFFGTVLSNSA